MKFKTSVAIRSIYILAILHCIILFFYCGRQWDYDTSSYITAWENISSYHIDLWRTPIYPFFIGISRLCFGSYYLLAGTVIQHIVFLISIWYFYKLTSSVINSERIVLLSTTFYALYPCYATWNCFILTEPFAIYSMVFTLYCAITAYRNNSLFHIIAFGFWILFQIFLRPAQLYILPVFLLGWIILLFKERGVSRIILGGIISIIFSTSIMLLYMLEFKKTYGLFTPCGVGVVNKYYLARRDGLLKSNNIRNMEFMKYVEENDKKFQQGIGTNIDLFIEAQDAVYIFGLETVSNIVSSNSNNFVFVSQIKAALQRFHNAANEKLFTTFIKKWSVITDIIGVRINLIYFLLFLYPLVIGYWWKKRKDFPWFSSILYLLGLSHLLIIIVACQNIWGRLILPVTPIYLIMIAQLCNGVNLPIKKEKRLFI